MSKSFFIVVPFGTQIISVKKGPLDTITNILPKKESGKKSEAEAQRRLENFEESKIQLQQRMAVVEQGLIRCGLRTVVLGSEELIELFYKLFNPGETDKVMAVG